MKNATNDVILSGNHIDLTPNLRTLVNEKLEKLFLHENHIIRIRVDLEYNANSSKQNEYIAKGYIEIKGPDLIASAESDDIVKSLDELVDKLDRMLRRRSRLQKVKRKDTHDVEIPASIPKAQIA
jgi:putative sigma-54 modulation protein